MSRPNLKLPHAQFSTLHMLRQQRQKSSTAGQSEQYGAGSLTSVGCCTPSTLDELLALGVRGENSHSPTMVHLPQSPQDVAVVSAIGYASLAGMKVGMQIFRYFGSAVSCFKKHLLYLKKKISDGKNLTPEDTMVEKYLHKQIGEARFQKWVAGALSGAASAAIFGGQFFMLFSSIGLGGLSFYGISHLGNSLRNLLRDCKTLHIFKNFFIMAHVGIQQRYLKKKIRMQIMNTFSWGIFTTGIGLLTGISILGMTSVMSGGVVPAFLLGFVFSTLGVGVLGTVVFNNILTSPRFLPTPLSEGSMEKSESSLQIIRRLQGINDARELVKAYRIELFAKRVGKWGHFGEVLKINSARFLNKLFMFASLGLIPRLFLEVKKRIKKMSVFSYIGDASLRWKVLGQLVDYSLQSAKNGSDDFYQGVDLLNKNDSIHLGSVLKIFAYYLTEVKLTFEPITKKNLKWFLKPRIKRVLKQRFLVNAFDKDCQDDLRVLANLKPCCNGISEGKEVLEWFLKNFKKIPPSSAHYLQDLFERSVDHYLVYQLRSDLKRNLGYWAERFSSSIDWDFSNRILLEHRRDHARKLVSE